MTPLYPDELAIDSKAITLFDYQVEDRAKVVDGFLTKGLTRLLGVWPTGCHAKGYRVLMYDGSTKAVEDVRVGDRLMGPDSTPRTVLQLCRGAERMFDIVPNKGEKWTVNKSHILSLRKRAMKRSQYSTVEVTVGDYLNWSKTQKHLHQLYRVSVDFPSTAAEMPIHPYFLGVLLGDGSISRNVSVATTDSEIAEACTMYASQLGLRIRVEAKEGKCPVYHFARQPDGANYGWYKNPLRKALVSLGLRPKKNGPAIDKFIPHIYKTASKLERLHLLAGLLDTDGSHSGGGYDFISKSKTLADDVAFVARSLGLAAYVAETIKTCQTGASGTYYRVSISGDCTIVPVRIHRKTAKPRKARKSVLVTGFKVVDTGKFDTYYGFTVDKDNLYLGHDFTVIRNSGKTILFSELHLEDRMRAWLHSFPADKRQILVLAHRDELISQAVNKIQRSNPDLLIGIEKAAQRSSYGDDVVVASVQTLSAAKGKRMRRMDPSRFRIVVVDEAHHAASPSYHAILQHFGFLPPGSFMAETRPAKKDGRAALLVWQRHRLAEWDALHGLTGSDHRLLLGVTATPKRGDNIGLECVFQDIVFERSIREMIERGRLCRLRAFRVDTDTSLDEVGTRAGDFEQEKLAETINVDKRNMVAVKAYLDMAPGRKGITFCANVAHAQAMAKAYQTAGVAAACVHGHMALSERRQILKDFAAGSIRMLTNCNVLTEGFDEPDVQVIIHARPTKSSLLYIQMTGRGLRVAPGKENCIIIDIVDITRKHSLVSSPELFGLPVDFDAKGEDLLAAKQQVESIQQQFPLADLSDVKNLEDCKLRVSEVDLLNNFHDEVLDQHAELVWERTGEGYELSWRGQLLNEFAKIVCDDAGQWHFQHQKGKKIVHDKTYPDAATAFKAGEKWLYNEKPSAWSLNRKNTKDGHEPATPDQKRAIRSFGLTATVDRMTKAEARMLLAHHFAKRRRYE